MQNCFFKISMVKSKALNYRKNSCISRTFLLKYWVQNHGCGLFMRPLLSEGVKLLVSRIPFVYYCVVTKQMFMIELRLIFVQTSTFSLPLWASAVKTTVVSCKNLRNRLKICS